ncbi:MAG TPA: cytochrome c [Gammaproteobacteria bacterium]|nr:cytochrome c [Gammaproteobacteria bacterium]
MAKALVASALLCCALGAAAQPSARNERAAAVNGQSVFLRLGCFTCHGTVGHGGAAPRLTPNTLPLEAFTTWVRDGTPGWTVASGMPAFPTSVLSDAELADIRAYLASLPAPPAVADVPLLAL